MDTIEVKGIRSYGYTGFLAEEKVLGQWFEVDLTIWVDLKPSGMSDDLNDTVDYRQAISIIKETIKNKKFDLVEKLAEVIAQNVLALEKITQVRIRLSKPAAPIPEFGGVITIDITRQK